MLLKFVPFVTLIDRMGCEVDGKIRNNAADFPQCYCGKFYAASYILINNG